MAYQTIRELVTHVRSLHRRLQESAREARADTDDERSALLLEFLDAHEAALARSLAAAEGSGGKAVLDTWLQFEPNAEVERAMAQRESADPLSGDELVTHVLETENALVRLYELLEGSTGSASVKAFFASLLDMEDSAVRRSARARLESADL